LPFKPVVSVHITFLLFFLLPPFWNPVCYGLSKWGKKKKKCYGRGGCLVGIVLLRTESHCFIVCYGLYTLTKFSTHFLLFFYCVVTKCLFNHIAELNTQEYKKISALIVS
jgi:hypothetical protein